jgi:uncharacterized membrane protein YbhN (UPF0104 family)
VLREADWRWTIVALALSAATYVGAGEAPIGFVAGRLSFRRTPLAQLASSFVTLVTPAAVGATLNIRYLQRQKIPAAAAAASVGVAQVMAFVLHVLLILVFAAIAGSSGSEPIQAPPQWAWSVLAGLVLIALVVLAIPAGRRMLRARLSPMWALPHRNQLRHPGPGLAQEQPYRVPGWLDKEVPVRCQRGLLAGRLAHARVAFRPEPHRAFAGGLGAKGRSWSPPLLITP